MAIYVPAARRRRTTIGLAVACLLVGLAVGGFAGRATAPTLSDRLNTVRNEARETAAALRVLALHAQSGAVSNQAPGEGGADLVLERVRNELRREFSLAPWLEPGQRDSLLQALDALRSHVDQSSPDFGTAAEALASDIEATFGIGSN